jgi:hypothetical protein
MGSKETTLVLRCVDPRYNEAQHISRLPVGFTVTGVASAKCFVEHRLAQDYFFLQLQLLQNVGADIQTIVIVDHLTCKGCNGDDSRETHLMHLRQAGRTLQHDVRCRDMKIELYLHDMNGNNVEPITLKEKVEGRLVLA